MARSPRSGAQPRRRRLAFPFSVKRHHEEYTMSMAYRTTLPLVKVETTEPWARPILEGARKAA